MPEPSLNELRRLVRDRHEAATKKVSRMRRVNGVDIGGTSRDVRRNPANIRRYTRSQLNAYLRELNHFQSRQVGYVRGADGTIFTRQQQAEFNRKQSQWNAKVRRINREIEGVNIGPLGKTVEQRRAERAGRNIRRAGGDTQNKPLSESHRRMSNIYGQDAYKKLMDRLDKQLEKGYTQKVLREQRAQFNQMARRNGFSRELLDTVENMNDYQFNIFFNETDAAEKSGESYFWHVNASESQRMAQSDALESNEAHVADLANFAATLKRPRGRR